MQVNCEILLKAKDMMQELSMLKFAVRRNIGYLPFAITIETYMWLRAQWCSANTIVHLISIALVFGRKRKLKLAIYI